MHAGAGELHLRPKFKNYRSVHQFRNIATEVAILVKKYRGSMSGEHADGIVRGEFLPFYDCKTTLLKRSGVIRPNSCMKVRQLVSFKMDVAFL
jgi:FAD/FMN-containing dehydrogenase